MASPKYPVLFYKPATAVTGPTDDIPVAPIAQEGEGLDYECELVIVIGKEAREVPESSALDYVLGYAIGNDVSHRDWQIKRGAGQWGLGKGFDGWAPFGPGIVTPSLIRDPNALQISTKLNGETVQNSSTADMIFSVAKTISFLSQGTTLLPGDLIFTGTYVANLPRSSLVSLLLLETALLDISSYSQTDTNDLTGPRVLEWAESHNCG